jgi:hypothetical protein
MPMRFWLLAFLLILSTAVASHSADVDGESLITPNHQRRVAQVNGQLPNDILDQSGDSRKVAELRGRLREALSAYRQAVRTFGSPTVESRQAAHQVLEAQKTLHERLVQEEAIPAVATASR